MYTILAVSFISMVPSGMKIKVTGEWHISKKKKNSFNFDAFSPQLYCAAQNGAQNYKKE